MRRIALLAAVLSLVTFARARADERSEEAAARLLQRRMERDNPGDAALLRAVKGRSIVVVDGSMDHIQQVLRAAHIEHTLVSPNEVANVPLKSNMIVMVNCPGVVPQAALDRLKKFVRAGGLLYTTDWALKNVVEKAFPGFIAHNGRFTADELVSVSVDQESDNLMSNMLLKKGAEPHWYLEGSSYPIRILDRRRVDVLAHSNQMLGKYGAAPVVVRFKYEDGEVIHVVSHFYRQLDARGPRIAAAKAIDSYEGLSDGDKRDLKKDASMGANAADVESSYAFQRMTANLVAGKQKQNAELGRKYNMTVRSDAPIALQPSLDAPPNGPAAAAAPPPAVVTLGASLKVLEKKGDKARVRDDEGNEGWVPAESLVAK